MTASAPSRTSAGVNDLGLVYRLHAHLNAVASVEVGSLRMLHRSAGERLTLGDFLLVCRHSFFVTRERFPDEALARIFRLLRDGDADVAGVRTAQPTVTVESLGYFLSIRPSKLGEVLKLGLEAFKRHAERQASAQRDRRRAPATADSADLPVFSSNSGCVDHADSVLPFVNDARRAQSRRRTGRVLQTSLRLYSPERAPLRAPPAQLSEIPSPCRFRVRSPTRYLYVAITDATGVVTDVSASGCDCCRCGLTHGTTLCCHCPCARTASKRLLG